MKYIETIITLRAHAETPHGKKLVAHMKDDVAWFDKHFTDDPSVDSGWGHEYFCAEDGSFLRFDLEQPTAHQCPICHKASDAPNYNAAWVYLYRYQALMSALEAATLFRLEEKAEYLAHFKRIVGFYAEHYDEFAVHGKGPTTSGNGKITPQALNEAIFLTKTVNGLEMLKEDLDAEFVQLITEKLLLPGAYFVNEQKKIIHNIPCWINAAVGTVGLFTGNRDLIEKGFDAPLGLLDQVRQGVTKSFFWYEGSIHYNCFTLESFLNLFLLADIYGKEIAPDVRETVYNMMLAPCKMAFSNTILPNPNDGWPNLNLKTYSYLYEMAAKIFDTAELRNILANIYAHPGKRTPLPMSSPVYEADYCMEWLLFSSGQTAPAPLSFWNESTSFEASDYAILRRKHCEVFLKYGHCSPSHAHPDKMNIEVSAFGTLITRDLSNCGYAARLCNEYHRTSVSHNTVVADGLTHPTTERGTCVLFDAASATFTAASHDAYPGVDFERTIQVTESGFQDTFSVTSSQTHTFDWVFHVEGELAAALPCEPAQLQETENGYQHLQQVRRICCDTQTLTLLWHFADGVTGEQTVSLKNATAYLCKSYDNPVNRLRNTLLLRTNEANAVFEQCWSFRKQ